MNSNIAWVWEWPGMDVSLNISKAVAEIFFHYRQHAEENERGGQLFVDLTNEDGLWLVDASKPHLDDCSGLNWLSLNQSRCTGEIEIANGKGLRLIGYWHTHPEEHPNISAQDIKSFKKFSKKNINYLQNPLVVIVGRSSTNAWIVNETVVEQARMILNDLLSESDE